MTTRSRPSAKTSRPIRRSVFPPVLFFRFLFIERGLRAPRPHDSGVGANRDEKNAGEFADCDYCEWHHGLVIYFLQSRRAGPALLVLAVRSNFFLKLIAVVTQALWLKSPP